MLAGAASQEERVWGENQELHLEGFIGTRLGCRDAHQPRGKDGESSIQRADVVPEKPSPFSGAEKSQATQGSKAEHTALPSPPRGCPEGPHLHVLAGSWLTLMGGLSRRRCLACRVCPGEGGAGRGGSPFSKRRQREGGFHSLQFSEAPALIPSLVLSVRKP